MYIEHDPRHMYAREQSIGFQYTNQPSSFGPVSPPTRAYAPTGPIHMAGPSRRPLPTPRSRPESMPPPPRQPPLVVQSPAPSRPAILAPSATLATSPTAPPARRPLPTPVFAAARPTIKHTSVDLTSRPSSPVKSIISAINTNPDRDLRIPSSFSRRTAPLPDANKRPPPPPAAPFSKPPPTWPSSLCSDAHKTQESKSAPLWNRNPPPASSAQIGTHVIERRSTVSGSLPPTIFPSVASLPRPDFRRSESPERVPPARRSQFSPSRRPLPFSPTEPPRVPSLDQRIAASSKYDDKQEPSSPSDVSSLSDTDSYEPMIFADPLQIDEGEEHEIMFAKHTHVSSSQHGIRDLPVRSRIAIANRDDSQHDSAIASDNEQEHAAQSRPVRHAALPQPPVSSSGKPQVQPQAAGAPQSPRTRMSPPVSAPLSPFSDRSPPLGTPPAEPQSLTLRFASMSLAEERERESQQQVSSPTLAQSPSRDIPSFASPARQQQRWPASVPPLPRTPGNTAHPCFGTTDISTQSQPSKPSGITSPSLATTPTYPVRAFPSSPNPGVAYDRKPFAKQSARPPPIPQGSQLSERQLEKQRARDSDIDLDDAPPPSLRRSPSPIRQAFAQAPEIEISNDTPPRRQWTPNHDMTSQISSVSRNGTSNSFARFRAGSRSPERRVQPLQSPTQAQPTAVPKISLPDGQHDDSGDDGAPCPSIVVRGPGISASVAAPGTPAISISETPAITVMQHAAPAISVSAADTPSISFSPPEVSVSDSAQPPRPAPSPGSFGSRHTQIQESYPIPARGPPTKRGLPPPPSPSNPIRTNGLSCGGCSGPIVGRIVSAMGQRWHPNCFRCSICNELLEHVSSYERDGKPYCHLDYHESFAPRCFHCKTAIIDERFITLDDPALGKRTYHEQHFFCAECGDPFLAPSGPLLPSVARTGELNVAGDGDFFDDDVGFTVYKGHPYCEACHVRLRMPKCKACKKSIRDGVRAVEALDGKWCWGCFVCEGCKKPFEDPLFFLRGEKPFCEPCFSLILRNEM